ncbi:tethering factor for nuclear proteasome STS1 [Elsinoe ampelina]|uniref:Tethering factor for nuclear proteasome STS1 n=1 Tax=Elsinoe ampelina TaxID=302913 RepID=A0A6A6GD68_9PEZI|nr:tethering factor for nuclear proteasome STS1 [Elsinoe ampelina]
MNSVIPTHTLFAPHLLENPRHSPPRNDFYSASTMSGRKRKASTPPADDRMSTSPTASPSVPNRTLPPPLQPRFKRTRTNAATGRPLDLPRLLETLSPTDLRSVITQLCTSHPSLTGVVTSLAPRPTLESTLSVLHKYEETFKSSFPFGNRPTSDYTYNRVKTALHSLLEALKDFTPSFLPPQEHQPTVSLSYLDAVTDIVHRLPNWDTPSHNRSKEEAYEELGSAWAAVVKEATKRSGGIQLGFVGWEDRVRRHHELSGGRLQGAVEELRKGLGVWGGGSGAAPMGSGMGIGNAGMEERERVRRELLSGNYGAGMVGGGQW